MVVKQSVDDAVLSINVKSWIVLANQSIYRTTSVWLKIE